MRTPGSWVHAAAGAVVALFLAAPLASLGRAARDVPVTLNVSAASSLTEAFGEIAAAFEAAHPDVDVALSFGGSQILRAQIEQGAPVDVFASADLAQMEPLVKASLMGPAEVFAKNRLVAVASVKSGKVKTLADLAAPGMRLVVAAATVPVGRYTDEVLAKMTTAGAWGDAFRERFRSNVVSEELNVRAVLSKVALGEADGGVVYRTDVGAAKNVTTLDIPDSVNVVATYPIAVVAKSEHGKLAEEFVATVLGEIGRALLAKHGFEP